MLAPQRQPAEQAGPVAPRPGTIAWLMVLLLAVPALLLPGSRLATAATAALSVRGGASTAHAPPGASTAGGRSTYAAPTRGRAAQTLLWGPAAGLGPGAVVSAELRPDPVPDGLEPGTTSSPALSPAGTGQHDDARDPVRRPVGPGTARAPPVGRLRAL